MLADQASLATRAAAAAELLVPSSARADARASIADDLPFRPPIDDDGTLHLQVSRAELAGWGAELVWWVLPTWVPEEDLP